MLKVWMDGHGRRPGTYFQYVPASSHFLGHYGGILESVHALLFSHFKHCAVRFKCNFIHINKIYIYAQKYIFMPVARGGSTGSIEPPLGEVEPPPPSQSLKCFF